MASKKRSSARISEKEKPSADDADDADDTKHAKVKETTKAKRAKLAAPFGSGRGGVFGYAQESEGPSPAFGGSPFTFGSGAGAGAGLGPPEAVAPLTFGQAPVKKACWPGAKSKDEARLNVQQARRELEEAHRDADLVRKKIARAKAKYERAAGDWIDWDLGVQPL
jgi:hypothetical protein